MRWQRRIYTYQNDEGGQGAIPFHRPSDSDVREGLEMKGGEFKGFLS